jgi:hypothetical protein
MTSENVNTTLKHKLQAEPRKQIHVGTYIDLIHGVPNRRPRLLGEGNHVALLSWYGNRKHLVFADGRSNGGEQLGECSNLVLFG